MKEEYCKENLELIVSSSKTFREVLIKLNKRHAGGNYETVKRYISLYDITTVHFETHRDRIKKVHKLPIDLNLVLVENSSYNRSYLKKRLYDLNLKQRNCELCGQGELWNGKYMSLILDHINGIWNDNRLENLRILCPNCNSTLDTHCGKNINYAKKIKESKKINTSSVPRKTKIEWPSKEELEKLVWELPRSVLSEKLEVSDVAISKHCKKLDIKQPERGYWQKKSRVLPA